MKITCAVCRVKGERVAVVAVQPSALGFQSEADRYIEGLTPAFDGIPVVLMGQTAEGKITWYGRGDLTDALGEVPVDRLPWQEMEADV